MKINILKLCFLVLTCIACLFACSKNETESGGTTGGGGTTPAITAITINPNNLELLLGDSTNLTVAHSPSSVSAPSYEWSSADATIASVVSGKVKGLKVGETTITAKIVNSNIKDEIRVKVLPIGPANLNLTAANNNIAIGEKVKINYEILPANTTGKENLIIEWSSDNTSVATIDNTGEVTAIAIGTATITGKIKDTNITKTIVINVTPVSVQSITLNATSGTLRIGNTVSLTATVLPANANNKAVRWTSSNSAVATVNTAGVVNAIAIGTAIITATTEDGNKTATYTLTVSAINVTGVTLNATSGTLTIGQTRQLTATVAPANATNKQVTWTSANNSIASVSSTGLITANAAGNVTITAKSVDGNKTASYTLTVNPVNVPVTGVTLNATSGTLTIGQTRQLTATVAPANATNKQVTWTSANNSIASVSSTGLITANAAGNVTITVKSVDGNKTASYSLTVSPINVTGVTLNSTSGSLSIGQTRQLTATIAPANATNKQVTWTSSNTNVATVSANGTITAVAAGSATITVKSVDGNKTATYALTVTGIEIETILLTISNDHFEVGQTSQPSVIIRPVNATDRNLTWTSSNPSVATINPTTGLITGVSPGATTITVRTTNGKTASKEVRVRAITITALNLNVQRLDIMVGDRFKLIPSATPSNASTSNLHWESSIPGIATVDQQGNVTAIANGTTNVKVSTVPGSRVYKQISVSVQNAQNTFKLTQTKGIIQLVGSRIDLNCTLSLSNPTPENITYAGFVVKDANNNVKSTVNANSTIISGGGIGFSYLLTNFTAGYTMYVKVIYKGTTYELPIELKRGN